MFGVSPLDTFGRTLRRLFIAVATGDPALVAVDFVRALDAVGCVGEDIQTGLGDFLLAIGANTIDPVLNSLKSTFNLPQRGAVVLHQADRKSVV